MNSIAELPPVLTPEEVAEVMRLSTDQVHDIVTAGKLEAFDFCGFTRISKQSFMKAIEAGATGIARTATACWNGGFSMSEFEAAKPFEFTWPTAKGERKVVESYPRAFKTLVTTPTGRILTVVVGITIRPSSGIEDRARVTVFVDGQPMVEFVGANDFERSQLLVSIIKPDGYKHLRAGQPVPANYTSFETQPFDEIVIGPRAKKGMAVVCKIDDLATMVRHAWLRWEAKHAEFEL